MIAYGFPPEGNAGAYRPLRFVRHLLPLGWRPTVVTLETDNYERYDPALIEKIPVGIEVIRVPNRDPWQTLLGRRAKRIQEKITNGSAEKAVQVLSSHQKPLRSQPTRAGPGAGGPALSSRPCHGMDAAAVKAD